jgi:hypothetical protein
LCGLLWQAKLEDGPEVNNVSENDVIISSDLIHPLSPDVENPPTIISQNGDVQRSLEVTKLKPSVRGKYLVSEDLKSIQATVDEFISKALLPYIERQSRLLHESVSHCLIPLVLLSIMTSMVTFIIHSLLLLSTHFFQIVNRRGMSKSFFSATKRLFGTGAKAASSVL